MMSIFTQIELRSTSTAIPTTHRWRYRQHIDIIEDNSDTDDDDKFIDDDAIDDDIDEIKPVEL